MSVRALWTSNHIVSFSWRPSRLYKGFRTHRTSAMNPPKVAISYARYQNIGSAKPQLVTARVVKVVEVSPSFTATSSIILLCTKYFNKACGQNQPLQTKLASALDRLFTHEVASWICLSFMIGPTLPCWALDYSG